MTSYQVRLFEIARSPGPSAAAPREIPGFAVDADDIDGARVRCRRRLEEDFAREVRSISCAVGGGLAAVVFAEGRVR